MSKKWKNPIIVLHEVEVRAEAFTKPHRNCNQAVLRKSKLAWITLTITSMGRLNGNYLELVLKYFTMDPHMKQMIVIALLLQFLVKCTALGISIATSKIRATPSFLLSDKAFIFKSRHHLLRDLYYYTSNWRYNRNETWEEGFPMTIFAFSTLYTKFVTRIREWRVSFPVVYPLKW